MSTVSAVYAGPIGDRYHNQEITLATQSGVIDWRVYPVDVSKEQFEVVQGWNKVFSVLTEKTQMPSKQAGLSGDLSPVIKQINSIYTKAMERYKDQFMTAARSDGIKISEMEAYGYENTIAKGIIWLFRRITSHHTKVVQAASAHRYKWIIVTEALEEKRLADSKDMIEQRSAVLIEDLKRELSKGFVNNDYVKELDQLEKVFRALFPQTQLEVGSPPVNVRAYLESVQPTSPI